MNRLFPSADSVRPRRALFSRYDLLVIPLILSLLYLLTLAFRGAAAPFGPGAPDLTVSLEPANLPYYGLRSLFRMAVAVLFSLLFTFTVATLAAKSPRAERLIIPALDFLQSLPILGFLTVTTAIFLGLFRGSLWGLEAASIFAIFTSQVWNIAFSFYHSLVTVPKELQEAATQFRLSPWQRFWRLEVPFATPSLVWNTMMSVSGGWFFVVASEVIPVVGRDREQYLPGLGSYLAVAIQQANFSAMAYTALAVLVLILVYDQLFFRPIVAWAEKFKFEGSGSGDVPTSWMLTLLQRSRFVPRLTALPAGLVGGLTLGAGRRDRPGRPLEPTRTQGQRSLWADRLWALAFAALSLALVGGFVSYLFGPGLGFANGRMLRPNPNLNAMTGPGLAARFRAAGVAAGENHTVWLSSLCAATEAGTRLGAEVQDLLAAVPAPTDLAAACALPLAPAGRVAWLEVLEVFVLGLYTALRVVVLVAVATLVWTPVGVFIGLRPRLAQGVQPLAQFLAAFPANLLFPVAVILIVRFGLSAEVWTAPLMILGAQWYILFNVIAGATAIPNDLREAARVSSLRGWPWWRRLVLPGIFPAFVTGGITASGGAWNASIVAEVVSWGDTTLVATGLGAYIACWSTGEFNPHVALGMLMMGLYVLGFNRLLWRRLYRLAETRYRLD